MTCRVNTLGHASVTLRTRSIDPSANLLFAGLLVLTLDRDRELTREQLASLLWPKAQRAQQGARLRWLLNRLRSLDVRIHTEGARVGMSPGDVTTDFDHAAELPMNEIGPVLSGYGPSFSTEFSLWLDARRTAITTRVVSDLLPLLRSARVANDWPRAIDVASALHRLDELNEEAVLTLAEAHCRLGAKARALATLQNYMAALGEDRPTLRLPAEVLRKRILDTDAPLRGPWQARFVGRVEHLERINGLLSAAHEGVGGALAIVGPAGIGKTRLIDEAIARASASRARIIRVSCQPGAAVHPLSGLLELIPKILALPGALGARPENFQWLSALAAPINDAGPDRSQASADTLRAQVCAALFDALDAVSAENRVVIALDDAQWSDSSIAWIWERLVAWVEHHPVVLLLGYRTPAAKAIPGCMPRLTVGSLGPAAAAELLADVVSRLDRQPTQAECTALIARGAGSPLVLCELARQWSLTGSVESLPTSLLGLFDAGMRSLSQPATRTLEAAAVLGTYATLERIDRVMQLPHTSFVDALAELESAGILTVDPRGAASGHVLWANVALRRIAPPVLRTLHAHAAAAFEQELSALPSASTLWEVARHWQQAGEDARAHDAIVRGAEHLARQGFPVEAADAYARLSAETDSRADALAFLRRHIELLFHAGRMAELDDAVARHEKLALTLNPGYDRHNALELMCTWGHFQKSGDHSELLHSSLACARDASATTSHRIAAANYAAKVAQVSDREVLSELHAMSASLTPQSADDEWNQAMIEWKFHYEVGDPHLAVMLAERMMSRYGNPATPREHSVSMECVGEAYLLVGRISDCRVMYRRNIEHLATLGFLERLTIAYDRLIGLSLDIDPPHVARALLEEAREPLQAFAQFGGQGYTRLFINHEAQLAILERRPADALGIAREINESLRCPVRRWRARFLAIHLAARDALGIRDRIDDIVASLESCFLERDHWLDWPAEVLASYLERARSHRRRHIRATLRSRRSARTVRASARSAAARSVG